jgi:hypothetical protein
MADSEIWRQKGVNSFGWLTQRQVRKGLSSQVWMTRRFRDRKVNSPAWLTLGQVSKRSRG